MAQTLPWNSSHRRAIGAVSRSRAIYNQCSFSRAHIESKLPDDSAYSGHSVTSGDGFGTNARVLTRPGGGINNSRIQSFLAC